MNRFVVVGMGPGEGDYILPAGEAAIRGADVLLGDERHLARYPNKRGIPFPRGTERMLEAIDRERRAGSLAVLVSGDPCLYSLHRSIAERFSAEEYELVPGLSSLQLACARARVPWDDALLVSVHGRPLSELERVPAEGSAVVFTDAERNAAVVARFLSHRLGPDRRCVVGERLGYADERVVDSNLETTAGMRFGGLAVLVLPPRGGS